MKDDNHNYQMVKCLCDCGNIGNYKFTRVVNGYRESCGCKRKSLSPRKNWKKLEANIGDKFGRLIIKEFVNIKYGEKFFKGARCLCDCGNYTETYLGSLIKGSTKSCGCYHREKVSQPKTLDIWAAEFNNYKNVNGQKYRKLDFKLTLEQFIELCNFNCYYCDFEPHIKTNAGNQYRNSIDRLDNSIGYYFENCVSCCGICNRMKSSLTVSEFFNQISNIYKNMFLNFKRKNVPIQKESTDSAWNSEYKRHIRDINRRNKKYSMNLSLEEYKSFCKNRCYYCGCGFVTKMHVGKFLRNGVDRKDNFLGYDVDNCVSCCWPCNKLKGRLHQEQFFDQIKKIYEYKLVEKNG